MARQVGEIAIIGTVGNMTYYRYKGALLGRKKSSLNKKKVMSLGSMEGTRRNMNEMGRASNAGKLLRHSINHLLAFCKDTETHNRLTAQMKKIINSDTVNDFGLRRVEKGDFSLLKGFDFNIDCGLESLFFGTYEVKVDRMGGNCSINIPSFSVTDFLKMPKAATHFQFVGAMVEIDFIGQETKRSFGESELIFIEAVESGDVSMVFSTEIDSLLPMFFVMGVHFYQVVNGVMERLTERAYNALQVVEVDQV